MSADVLQCERHEEKQSVALCAVCAMPICESCRHISSSGTVCGSEHEHFLNSWKLVVAHQTLSEIDALARNLFAAGIGTSLFSLHDHVEAHWSLHPEDARLFVRTEDHQRAVDLLRSLNLFDSNHASTGSA